MQNCEKCVKTQRKCKALEMDLQFQIKKLNQDMATQKITLQITHQKQLKRIIEKINQQKTIKEGQVKCWMLKYDTMVGEYQQKLVKLQAAHEKNILSMEDQIVQTKLSEMKKKQSKILQQKDVLQLKYEKQKIQMVFKNQQNKKAEQRMHQQLINKINSLHKQEIAQFYLQIQKLNDRIKQLLNNSSSANSNVSQLNEELKKVKIELQRVNQQLDDQKILVKIKSEMKQKEVKVVKEETVVKINKIQKDFDRQKNQIISEKNKKVKSIMEGSLKIVQQFQQKLKEINRIRQLDLRIYNQNLEDLRKFSEEVYIPKNKFDEEINNMNVKLINKEKDVERAKNEVKQYKLQIVNKEDTYIKFLGGNSSYVGTAPDIFVRSPCEKKKEYSIKKHNRTSFNSSFNQQLDNSPLLKPRTNESASKISISLNKSATSSAKTQQNLDRLILPELDSNDAFSF